MTIENVRIAVLDAYDNVLTFMYNLLPKSLHYYDDTLHEYLKGSTYTYSFSASADHPDSQYLVEGNKLAFVYREKNYYLTIMTVEKDEYTVTCEAFGLPFELLNEDKEAYKAPEAMTFEEYLAVFDPEGIITLGLNEVSDKSITHEWTGTESMLARLYSLATAFDAEVEFQAVLHDNYSLSGIILNVYKEHGDGSQGMGENRMDTILRYGKEVNGVRKTADTSELYTAIRPTGKDGLDITSIEINEYDENGNLEYSSPQGNRNIYAVQAKDRFPSNLTAPATERYIALVWSYDTDNVNVLAGQALARLKEVCVPNVRYEVSGYVDANIGDTFVIQDEEYTPQLLLSARVTEQERSFTDPSQNKTVFDNFTELESQISEDLIGRVEELIQANKSYSAYIDSNNGLVFKNNTGSTTLTATVTSGTEDVTADMIINWFRDGSTAGSGTTLTVNAEDVEETAVYSIQAINENGDIVAKAQVTIADVYDGAAGQPGPAGESSYTHIAYANSADGTVDFSTTDSNRSYVGMYVDNVQQDSSDPSKYKWTLIKGADGTQGIPGTPGADGRTPYFHVAYANSADGQTDFSTTEADGKTYMGTYTDYTADDSTDPDDYTWMKVQGPTGPQGEQGIPGPAGADGRTTYFHVKYSANPDGNPMSESTNKYIGTYTDFSQQDSPNYTDYTWAQFQGDPGEQGIPGQNGENGQTSYLHIAYSNSFDGQTDFSTTDSENKSYIGVYVDFNQSDPSDPSLYTWTKVQGPAGPTGPQGIRGPQGENGQTTYFHVKYSENPDGNPMSETPSTYIGTYVDFVQLDSDDHTDYTWSRFQGMPGDQGIPGTNGTDGKTSYLHIAYANSVDGTVDFSTTDPTGRAYMGTYVDFVQSDSGNPETYTWVKVQGETGPEGQPGQDGTPGKDGKMLYATSLSLASYATKEAYLQDNQTITDEDLYVGITVSVMFDSGNTASNPQLKLSECSAYPIMCQGLNYAYWRNDQTVVFTWDGTYWRVASEPVYAAMVLVGSATGKNVYVSSSGVAIRDGSVVLALYGETTDIGKADAQHVHIDKDSVDIMDGDQVLASFGANTIIGDPNGLHTEIGETGFEIAYPISVGTGNQIFDKLRLSPGGIAIKTGEETSDDFLQFVVFNTVTDKTDIPGLQKNGFDVPNTRDIQSGISGNYQVSGGQNVQVNVTFPNKYPVGVEPVVVCTAMPATNNQASFESGILNVSRMGFTALVTNRGDSNYTIKLAWMSMTPTE